MENQKWTQEEEDRLLLEVMTYGQTEGIRNFREYSGRSYDSVRNKLKRLQLKVTRTFTAPPAMEMETPATPEEAENIFEVPAEVPQCEEEKKDTGTDYDIDKVYIKTECWLRRFLRRLFNDKRRNKSTDPGPHNEE